MYKVFDPSGILLFQTPSLAILARILALPQPATARVEREATRDIGCFLHANTGPLYIGLFAHVIVRMGE